MTFFSKDVLLSSEYAGQIYAQIKDLPIIDYHCHLDPHKIKADATFRDLGELWLAEDHYKWRAMRLCGVDEPFITGSASWREKFMAYAGIVPLLAGNPLYDWTHLELRQVFGITEPLNGDTAERIYKCANEQLKHISVSTLLRQYKVEFIATTDDPCDLLDAHGQYKNTVVSPTFRPDKLLSLDGAYLARLSEIVGFPLRTLADILRAAEERLRYFVGHGCKISDHGFRHFPACYPSADEAEALFAAGKYEEVFGYLLTELARLYKKYNVIMQLHFDVLRNVNREMYEHSGADAGFDVIADGSRIEDVVAFLQQFSDDERPEIVLYPLNDCRLPALACLTGAFRHVRMGAAWWFNDTASGIRQNLSVIAEYSVLGTFFGMLTDSRSFSSYVRFDFFRRILSDYLGGLVGKGECDPAAARLLAERICYYNIKEALGL